MGELLDGQRTLTKNTITGFILKIEFAKLEKKWIALIAEKMSKYFDRAEKRIIQNFAVTFTDGDSSINKEEKFDFVLVSETKKFTLTFSEVQNSFFIESHQYTDNSIYKEIVSKIIDTINETDPEIHANRIGLRYINEFRCEKKKDISKIFGKRLSVIVKDMLGGANQSRVIGVEEYNLENHKMRFQYGVANKYYPSVITSYDLVMDIDSYADSSSKISDWAQVISDLNHAAYEKFSSEIKKEYLEELK